MPARSRRDGDPSRAVGTIEDYDAVVLGSAVYAGNWLDEAKELIDRSRDAFAARPAWLFSGGPVGDPSRKMVQKIGEDLVDVAEILETTKAREHRMFAGKLEKKNLSFPEQAILIAFRGMEGDFRNRRVERGSERIVWADTQCSAPQARWGGSSSPSCSDAVTPFWP